MQLDFNDLKDLEKHYTSQHIDNNELQTQFKKEVSRYSKLYVLTNFVNIIVVALAFLAGSFGDKTMQSVFIFAGFIYIFAYIDLQRKAKHLAYLLALLHKKS